ncbi:MAG: hypothetical protein KAV82_16900 [Phycisphaerae bacterium]|nr:hypothetical protein [Phycisphaerae bacterium]
MEVNQNFSDLLRTLNDAGARFLVVGAYAVAYHTEPRFTQDLDIWVEPSSENAARVWEALRKFGAPLQGVTRKDFADSELVYQIGIEPNRIDVMMGIDGVTFPTAWRNRVRTTYGGIPVHVLNKVDLLRAKRAVGRPQDLLDIERLTAHEPRRRPGRKRR